MDTYSDNNSAPPEVPDESRGSSVSTRLQDEYEELLKYAVVVPKIDVDDLPRLLTDSKKSFAQHKRPSPPEIIHDSESDYEDTPLQTYNKSTQGRVNQGRVISPGKAHYESETEIHTVTPKRFSPKYSADRVGFVNYTDSQESESESELAFERTLHSSEREPVRDADLKDIERKLDGWTRQLNCNIMEEITKLKIKQTEAGRHQLQVAESRHAGEINTLRNDLEGMKELLHTYEVSIERKDGVIANLTRSLQNQKERFDTLKTFADWKIQFAANKQEGYGMRLAAHHHNMVLKRRCWRMWHLIIVERWRHRVEKACQAKAQEVCMQLTNDYEAKLKSIDESYALAREEVMSLHKQREAYEETMKKAFMRGVCALNMEAMHMFHEPTTDHSNLENEAPDHLPTRNPEFESRPVVVAHEPAYTSSTATKRLIPNLGGKPTHKPAPMQRRINISAPLTGGGHQVLIERHEANESQPEGQRSTSALSNPRMTQKHSVQASRLVKVIK